MADDPQTLGDAILEVLRAYGVEYVFSSPGSEWVMVWDALARAGAEGKGPIYVDTRHADLALLVGSQTPWFPASRSPKNARIILFDDDPAHEISPYWPYAIDQAIGGDLTTSLEELVGQVK